MNVPPSHNSLRRTYRNHFSYARLRGIWEKEIWYSARPRDREWLQAMSALGKKMAVRILISHARLYDVDNAYASCKPVLDSLVKLRFLKDDDPAHLELKVEQESIRAKQTSLTISEA
jgi:hypothetical protein